MRFYVSAQVFKSLHENYLMKYLYYTNSGNEFYSYINNRWSILNDIQKLKSIDASAWILLRGMSIPRGGKKFIKNHWHEYTSIQKSKIISNIISDFKHDLFEFIMDDHWHDLTKDHKNKLFELIIKTHINYKHHSNFRYIFNKILLNMDKFYPEPAERFQLIQLALKFKKNSNYHY